MLKLDELLESVTNPEPVIEGLEVKEVSPNFLMESAMLYQEAVEADIQMESRMAEVNTGLEALFESTAFTPEQKTEKTELIIEAAVEENGEKGPGKVKQLISWIKGIIKKVVDFIKDKMDRVAQFDKKHGADIAKLGEVKYKGFDYKLDAFTVTGSADKIIKAIEAAGLRGKTDAEAQKKAMADFNEAEFKKEVVKIVLGKEAADVTREAKTMLQGGEAKELSKSGSSMLATIKGTKATNEKAKNELLQVEKKLNQLYADATKLARDAASMKKAGKTSEAATLSTYATKQISVTNVAMTLLNMLVQIKIAVTNAMMNDYIKALKGALRAAGKEAGKDEDKTLNESAVYDSIGCIDELDAFIEAAKGDDDEDEDKPEDSDSDDDDDEDGDED